MKKMILSFVFIMVFLSSLPLLAQVEKEAVAIGLPGDNLNLYAVLDVFQKSRTTAEFERSINSKQSSINNLDLNKDGVIDYIRVITYSENDSRSIVLRVPINSSEGQDVAVIEINKDQFGNAVVQIIGDEELYGKDYIIEPTVESNSKYSNDKIKRNNYWNDVLFVNDWPIIIHFYTPSLVMYISPWYWNYYPSYWHPRPSVFYYQYWAYHNHYYSNQYYRRVGYLRFPMAYSYYYSRRNASPIVYRNRIKNRYRSTYEGRMYQKPLGTALPRASLYSSQNSLSAIAPYHDDFRVAKSQKEIKQNRQKRPSGMQLAPQNKPTNRQPSPRSSNPQRKSNNK